MRMRWKKHPAGTGNRHRHLRPVARSLATAIMARIICGGAPAGARGLAGVSACYVEDRGGASRSPPSPSHRTLGSARLTNSDRWKWKLLFPFLSLLGLARPVVTLACVFDSFFVRSFQRRGAEWRLALCATRDSIFWWHLMSGLPPNHTHKLRKKKSCCISYWIIFFPGSCLWCSVFWVYVVGVFFSFVGYLYIPLPPL